jgi:hypothetical protein
MGANIDVPEEFLMNANAFRHFYGYHFTVGPQTNKETSRVR